MVLNIHEQEKKGANSFPTLTLCLNDMYDYLTLSMVLKVTSEIIYCTCFYVFYVSYCTLFMVLNLQGRNSGLAVGVTYEKTDCKEGRKQL